MGVPPCLPRVRLSVIIKPDTLIPYYRYIIIIIIIIIIEGLSLLQSIPPTTADKQTQAQKRRGSRSRKLLGAKVKATGKKTKLGW